MADLSDIENVLVTTVAQAVYPNGTGSPSIANADCRVYRGWPIPANLDADLKAGAINITVFPLDIEQRTTRYPREWQELSNVPPALTLTNTATTITVGGTPSSPLNAAALVNGIGYVYAVQPGDTLNSIATGLAALIDAGTPATSVGPVITIPGAKQLAARAGGFGTIVRETKRQKRSFLISFWCQTPALRDTIAKPVDRMLAGLDFIQLPDGSSGRLLYERTTVSDRVERQGLYRRDIAISVEYATTDSQAAPQLIAQIINITGGLDPNAPTVKSFTI